MRNATLLLFFFLLTTICYAQIAQDNLFTYEAEEVIYSKEFFVGLKFHTNGFGVSLNKGKVVDYYKQNILQLELMEIRHPKESRQQSLISNNQQNAKSFKFGKINNFYNLNLGVGKRRLLTEKANKSGVAVSLFYMGGLSIGLQKPYYLELFVEDDETGQFKRIHTKYSEETANIFLLKERIVGSSGLSYGLSELKLIPGIHTKVGMNFDWASLDEYIKALELGLMFNAYYKRVPIIATEDNNFLYVNLYIKFMLGKRS